MSGFLGNLIARAAQRAPTLQRRRPTLFEPVEPGRSVQPDTGRGDDPSHRSTLVPPERPAVVARDRDTVAPVRLPGSGALVAVPAQHAAGIGMAIAPVRRQTEAGAAAITPAAGRAVSPAPLGADPDRAAANAALPAPGRREEREPADAADEGASRVTRATRRAESLQASPPGKSRDSGHVLAPLASATARAVKLVRASEAPPGDASAAGRPTVRVSIGRLEIRAASPSEGRTVPAARPAPRLNLDDYLQRRSRGSR